MCRFAKVIGEPLADLIDEKKGRARPCEQDANERSNCWKGQRRDCCTFCPMGAIICSSRFRRRQVTARSISARSIRRKGRDCSPPSPRRLTPRRATSCSTRGYRIRAVVRSGQAGVERRSRPRRGWSADPGAGAERERESWSHRQLCRFSNRCIRLSHGCSRPRAWRQCGGHVIGVVQPIRRTKRAGRHAGNLCRRGPVA